MKSQFYEVESDMKSKTREHKTGKANTITTLILIIIKTGTHLQAIFRALHLHLCACVDVHVVLCIFTDDLCLQAPVCVSVCADFRYKHTHVHLCTHKLYYLSLSCTFPTISFLPFFSEISAYYSTYLPSTKCHLPPSFPSLSH